MKIKLKYFFQPARSVRAVARKLKSYFFQRRVGKELKNIKRGVRYHCWCGGSLKDFKSHKSYKVCSVCGSYVNIRPPLPEEFPKIYSFDFYWHLVQSSHGYPSIEERYKNDRKDGRIDFWKKLIQKYAAQCKKIIEAGCAYGGLLYELQQEGYDVIGIEPDAKTADWAREKFNIDVKQGLFPDVNLPKCDLFLAFDVLEHSYKPAEFMKKVSDILNPGGIAIIQVPIDRYDFKPPFGERFDDIFNDVEHMFLFTDKAMEELTKRAGLKIINKDKLWLAAEIVIFQKN
ncbi:MAG: class I SAM-dependent methyltransferase [bacterium]